MPPRYALFALLPLAALSGCSRPSRTAEQVAGPTTPSSALRLGPTPPGGPSEAATGAGAGGSAAAGYEAGRVGSTLEEPVLPPQPTGITYSRMSPVGSSGSGLGDRGNPIPPDVSLAAPPDPVAPVRLAPHNTNGPQGSLAKPVLNDNPQANLNAAETVNPPAR